MVVDRANAIIDAQGCVLSQRIFEFVETLRIPSGKGQGEPFKLRVWQKALIVCTFEPTNDDGTRRIRRALWSMARKNGKTALSAALLLCALFGPLSQTNGEVYSAAVDREQAAIIYKMAAQMIRLDPELDAEKGGFIKCLDTTKRLVCYSNSSSYQSLSADAHRQHGKNSHFVIYDELAQAPNREMYDVLVTGFDAQENALLLVISTQSDDPMSIMSELADDAIAQEQGLLDDPYFFGQVFRSDFDPHNEAEENQAWGEKNWYDANPGLGDFKLLNGMRSQCEKAKRSPTAKAAFLNLQLNLRVSGSAAFLNSTDWKACARHVSDDELAGATCVGGLDLSGKRDLTALVLLFALADGRLATRCYFWTPADRIGEREKEDGARYQQWAKEGYITIIPGPVIDYETVAKEVAQIHQKYKIDQLAFDRYRADDFKKELNKLNTEITMVPHGQGYKDMGMAIDDLEESALQHRICHGGNPVLTYCMQNVRVSRDPADNRKFDKRQRNKRIDGAVALAMAHTAYKRPVKEEKTGPSVYEQRGVLAF